MKYLYSVNSHFLLATIPFLLTIILSACQPRTQQTENKTARESHFQPIQIADSLEHIWAYCPADITGDGLLDLVYINNNGFGGSLMYLKGQTKEGQWEKHIIAAETEGAGTFAQGDLECADMDFDGDLDIVASRHPGEWKASGDPSKIYWFENPTWESHLIGEVPNFIKDISLVDFNKDQKTDLAALNFETSTLTILQQHTADVWKIVQQYSNYKNLHEGMAIGDIDGDGWIDIVANAHIFYNPGADLTAPWREETVDEIWNTQTGDWSRNGTKAFLQDINGDQKAEIFISHSERSGYPLVFYQKTKDGWNRQIVADSIPACHTLQVFDFDQDGDYDVLAGVNKSRAKDLGFSSFPVTLFLSENNYNSWKPRVFDEKGIYNGQVADFDGDGDLDIFRLPTHDATDFYLLINVN